MCWTNAHTTDDGVVHLEDPDNRTYTYCGLALQAVPKGRREVAVRDGCAECVMAEACRSEGRRQDTPGGLADV